VTIQKCWRGHRIRREPRIIKRLDAAVKIQSLFRMYRARLLLKLLKWRAAAIVLIKKKLRKYIKKWLTFYRTEQLKLQHRPATIIQRVALKYIERKRVRQMISCTRMRIELKEYAVCRLNVLKAEMQLSIMGDSMGANFASAPPPRAHTTIFLKSPNGTCPGRSPVMALFTAISNGKAVLPSNNFLRLARQIHGLITAIHSSSQKSVPIARIEVLEASQKDEAVFPVQEEKDNDEPAVLELDENKETKKETNEQEHDQEQQEHDQEQQEHEHEHEQEHDQEHEQEHDQEQDAANEAEVFKQDEERRVKPDSSDENKILLVQPARQLSRQIRNQHLMQVDRVFSCTLFHLFSTGYIQLPPSFPVSRTDVDLNFARAKSDRKARGLSFPDFLEFVQEIAFLHFQIKIAKISPDPPDRTQSPLLLNPRLRQRKLNPFHHENSSKHHHHSFQKTSVYKKTIETKNEKKKIIEMLPMRLESLQNETSTRRAVLLILKLLISQCAKPWCQEVTNWMELESQWRLGLCAIPLQASVRGFLGRKRFKCLKSNHDAFILFERKNKDVVHIQKIVRGFLQRQRTVKLAQSVYLRYDPLGSSTYYMNSMTQQSYWIRPKLLRSHECVTIPLPSPQLDYRPVCGRCRQYATYYCDACLDSYCTPCAAQTHKVPRSVHFLEPIPICSYCSFQAATKICVTCVSCPPSDGSVAMRLPQSRRGDYCDRCFSAFHEILDQTPAAIMRYQRRNIYLGKALAGEQCNPGILELCLRGHVETNHRFTCLTVKCEECIFDSAAWRCSHCSDQLYCHKCLTLLHSTG
jgi:hypothetical protein